MVNRAWRLLPLVLVGAGCALLTGARPEVEVQRVELLGAGPLEQVLGVTLCVTNPNDSEIAFRRVTVAAEVSGSPVASSSSDSAVRLPPRASVLVPFTAVTTVRNLGPQVLGVLRTGAVTYRVRGSVELETMGITLPFSRSGRLDLLADGGRLLADVAAPGATRCEGGAGRP